MPQLAPSDLVFLTSSMQGPEPRMAWEESEVRAPLTMPLVMLSPSKILIRGLAWFNSTYIKCKASP